MRSIWKHKWIVMPVAVAIILAAGPAGAVALAGPGSGVMAAAAIARESSRLQRTLDALLTLSRYDSREFHSTMEPVEVDRLVQEEVDALVQAGWADAARIEVRAEPRVVATTDAGMLRQVAGSLLRNALQYGGQDPITVWVRDQPGRPADGHIIIDVINGGQPLTEEERARLFERFFRARSARPTEGLGLGLALSREICELLGGRVELVGGGPATHLRVTIPKSARGGVLPYEAPISSR